jgi:hypothetical protein
MNKPEDAFEERLERLRAGESLDGLAEDDGELLSLASSLGDAQWPEREQGVVNAQRSRAVAAFKQEVEMDSQESEHGFFHRFTKVWRLPAALTAGMAAVMICGLVSVVSLGSYFLLNREAEMPVVRLTEEEQFVEEVEPAEEAGALVGPGSPLAAGEALLTDVLGLVQMLEGEAWVLVQGERVVAEGAHLRTGALSSAVLTFNDGSSAMLGPVTELTIDALDVDTDVGAREVVLTQYSGHSNHQVVPMEVEDSVDSGYTLNTPSATGAAMGTEFHVRVGEARTGWYVADGSVEVSGVEASVTVGAGEMTQVALDEEPEDPVHFFTGQGEVEFIGENGENWVIGGQTYLTHTATVVIGAPLVGDIVFYEGHLEDEAKVLDLILLIRRNPANTFTLVGEVEEMGETLWVVNGQTIAVTDLTEWDEDIEVGDLVRVEGIVLPGGSLQAEYIILFEDLPGTPFDFTGVVEEMGEESWLVSDVEVTVDDDTDIDEGLAVGDLVRVQGWVLEDGTWLASSIKAELDESSAFEFTGYIESMSPWVVSGIGFETREWTVIDDDLELGDLVRVKGLIQADGTWVAYEIQKVDEGLLSVLIGRVFSMNPWVVAGVSLNVDEETVIVGEITVGMLVRVEMLLLPDGTHKVLRIEPVEGYDWELECEYVVVRLISVGEGEIHVEGWPALKLAEDVEIVGDLKAGALVQIMICFDEDMNVSVVYIMIIFEAEIPPDDEYGEKVMICHKPLGPNPHTIVVSASAVPAHLGHGDFLGTCPYPGKPGK